MKWEPQPCQPLAGSAEFFASAYNLVLVALQEELPVTAGTDWLAAVFPERSYGLCDGGVRLAELGRRGPTGGGPDQDFTTAVTTEVAVKLSAKCHLGPPVLHGKTPLPAYLFPDYGSHTGVVLTNTKEIRRRTWHYMKRA